MQTLVLIIGFFVFSQKSYATDVSPHIQVICDQLFQSSTTFNDYPAHFTEGFRKAVSLDYLKSVLHSLYEDTGACKGVTVTDLGQNKYLVAFHGTKKMDSLLNLRLNAESGLIDSLLSAGVTDPHVVIHQWDDLPSAFQHLDQIDHLSASLVTGDGKVLLSNNPEKVFAIGSTFKLYVMGRLLESIKAGEHSWNETFPIQENWKSLPSGTMQDLSAGTPVSLYQYAENMISISDNTATDHLLYLLGREKVESMLLPMGNRTLSTRLPFLSTLEMFKLKWALPSFFAKTYLKATVLEKRAVLELLHSVPRQLVGRNGVSMDQPTLIDQLEWFGTTQENCKAMLWLGDYSSPELRKIFSKSTPLVTNVGSSESHWSYVGYKGGSEPGVLSMTYLLETPKGTRACLSVSWNNTQTVVSQNHFFDLVSKLLKWSESKIQ